MSASLVGSEMCIRDSLPGALRAAPALPAAPAHPRARPGRALDRPRQRGPHGVEGGGRGEAHPLGGG
eukprot:11160491-Alexandrium_andersonii.AAC.1